MKHPLTKSLPLPFQSPTTFAACGRFFSSKVESGRYQLQNFTKQEQTGIERIRAKMDGSGISCGLKGSTHTRRHLRAEISHCFNLPTKSCRQLGSLIQPFKCIRDSKEIRNSLNEVDV